jgi:hypothetical protein
VAVSPELVRAYWQHYEASFGPAADRAKADECEWAWLEAKDVAEDGGPQALALVSALAEEAPSDDALAYLGAGPLEELLDGGWQTVVTDLEQAALASDRLRLALGWAHLPEAMPSDVQERLRRVAPVR